MATSNMERKVKSLHIYPVKSLGGISVAFSQVTSSGLQFDRNWMLIDEAGNFMTQRKFPEMASFAIKVSDHSLEISNHNDTILAPFADSGPELETKVWGDKIQGKEVSEETSNWLSEKFGFRVKLIHFATLRRVPDAPGTEIPFSDSSPFLLISEPSMVDLNTRMKDNLSITRFRPNIVVSGFDPYEEDTWHWIRIGSCRFQVFKKCARCQLPNVNPETAKVDKSILKFLSTYRKDEINRINFGVHLILIEGKVINVGDVIELLSS